MCGAALLLVAMTIAAAAADVPSLSATGAIVVDGNSGEVLYEKNGRDPRPAASMTKLMSLYLIYEEMAAGHMSFDTPVTVSRKAEWPDWRPPPEMLQRQPYLPRFMAGGPGNPMGARALYLGSSLYRIHGTNEPNTIGQAVSSGCIRMTNDDVVDLYGRVRVGAKVLVI